MNDNTRLNMVGVTNKRPHHYYTTANACKKKPDIILTYIIGELN
jgi:hypothetical protein